MPPESTGWYDGIPEGEQRLWMSTRIFSSDGEAPQQPSWTIPRPLTDTADIEFYFSSAADNPGDPYSNSGNWHGGAGESDVWMAIRRCKNGVWSGWNVYKVKGEAGPAGADGKDGVNGKTTLTYYKWSGSKPMRPTAASLSMNGGIPYPAGWLTESIDRMTYQNPDPTTLRDWSSVNGYRRIDAGVTTSLKQGELVRVFVPAKGSVDVELNILAEPGYDFAYVSPFYATKSAAANGLVTMLGMVTKYADLAANGYDQKRAVAGTGFTIEAKKTVTVKTTNTSDPELWFFVAYVKDSSDSNAPNGWTGGYARYMATFNESMPRYSVSGIGELQLSGTTYSFTGIVWGDVASYANEGMSGITPRHTYWQAGKEYRNDTGRNADPRFLDFCSNMPIAMVTDPNFKMYMCVKTHVSSASIPLGAAGYWSPMNSMQPIVTMFLLAQLIKAEYIDVEDLVANQAFINSLVASSAFINNLTVKKLETDSGKVVIINNGSIYAEDARLSGTIASAFKPFSGATGNAGSLKPTDRFDNMLISPAWFPDTQPDTSVALYLLTEGADEIGRRVTVFPKNDNRFRIETVVEDGGQTSRERGALTFYDDGEKKSYIVAKSECLELLGVGDSDAQRFDYWMVLERHLLIPPETSLSMKTIAYGRVTGRATNGSCTVDVTSMVSGSITCQRNSQGVYTVYFPSTLGLTSSNYFVMLTGVGYELNTSGGTAPIKATLVTMTSSYFTVETSDDESLNDGSFNFMIMKK